MKESVTYKILFAVGRFGTVILNCNDTIKELVEFVTISRLHGLVSNVDDIPTEIGLYTGLLTIEHWTSELEYATNWGVGPITLSGCMKLNKLEL